MIGFVSAVPVAASAPAMTSSFTSARLGVAARPVRAAAVPTMALRATSIRRSPGTAGRTFGGVANILSTADRYMAKSIVGRYKATACPTGTYGVQCTESTGKLGRTADAARIAALNAKFRQLQRSPAKVYGDMYENRRQAIKGTICHAEEKRFQAYSTSTAAFVLGRAEAAGACDKYGIPETVEEAAMMRYMHIQQQAKAVGGVIPSSCVEGASRGAADDARVAQLASRYRNAQKPTGQLLQEKFNQVKYGLSFANGCNYEEGMITSYPAVGSCFRPTTYGY
jgi:hypothetical protein